MSNTTKPTTQNQIIDYLQITTDEYNDNLFQIYWNWCQKYADSDSKVQQLLANTQVSNWFMMEYTKLQNQFLVALPHLPLNHHSLEYFYNGFVVQIFKIYPKAMIDILKPNTAFKSAINKNILYGN